MDAAPPADGGGPADSGGTGPACDPALGANACGGDPKGTWDYHSACSNDSAFNTSGVTQACPNATFGNAVYAASGTLTINNDGTFTRNVNTMATGTFSVPQSCAQPFGGCSGLASTLMQAAPGYTFTCTTNANQGCDCTVSHPVVTNDNGNYTVNNNIITASGTQYYFCSNNGLTYRAVQSDPSGYNITYTLTRH
jgi:hypothetical protein